MNEWFGKHSLVPMEWQWFFCMAAIGTDGMAIVFNGLQPLVKQWNGNDASLRFICVFIFAKVSDGILGI